MINLPTPSELDELQAFKKTHCLTVYIPLLDPNETPSPNRIEFKNLLKEAETALTAAGANRTVIEKTLEPARHLMNDRELWPPRHNSLVLFMHPDFFRYYHLPTINTPYLLTVETGFKLGPLLEIMAANQQYFVLALSHKNVRLYEGDRYHMKRLRPKHFPTDMKQALNIDEYPNWRETHTIAPTYSFSGKGSEAVHGQYNVRQVDKDMLKAFFRQIDSSLHEFLRDKTQPLLMAGVEYLLPIYRQINTYPLLIKNGLTGNFEKLGLDTIHKKTWEYLESTKQSSNKLSSRR